MPWKEFCAMDQKVQMIGDWTTGEYSITELGQIYGVSRKTIYKWIERYGKKGACGLDELASAPGRHPNAILPTYSRGTDSGKNEASEMGTEENCGVA